MTQWLIAPACCSSEGPGFSSQWWLTGICTSGCKGLESSCGLCRHQACPWHSYPSVGKHSELHKIKVNQSFTKTLLSGFYFCTSILSSQINTPRGGELLWRRDTCWQVFEEPFLLPHGCIILCSYQFPHWDIFGWFPVWDSYEQSLFKHLYLLFRVCVSVWVCACLCFYFIQVNSLESDWWTTSQISGFKFKRNCKPFVKWPSNLTVILTGLQLLRILDHTSYGRFTLFSLGNRYAGTHSAFSSLWVVADSVWVWGPALHAIFCCLCISIGKASVLSFAHCKKTKTKTVTTLSPIIKLGASSVDSGWSRLSDVCFASVSSEPASSSHSSRGEELSRHHICCIIVGLPECFGLDFAFRSVIRVAVIFVVVQ